MDFALVKMTIHSGIPPPPPITSVCEHSAMQAFPQEIFPTTPLVTCKDNTDYLGFYKTK